MTQATKGKLYKQKTSLLSYKLPTKSTSQTGTRSRYSESHNHQYEIHFFAAHMSLFTVHNVEYSMLLSPDTSKPKTMLTVTNLIITVNILNYY